MKKIFSIPNFLTFSRLIFTILFLVLFLKNKILSSIVLLGTAIITDFLDGFLARILKQKTKLGSFFDPLTDKILVISTLLILTSKNNLPWWFSTIVISREVLVSVGWLITYQHTISIYTKPRFLGKVSVALEMSTIVIVIINSYYKINIINDIINEMFFITSIFVFGSLLDYITYSRKILADK